MRKWHVISLCGPWGRGPQGVEPAGRLAADWPAIGHTSRGTAAPCCALCAAARSTAPMAGHGWPPRLAMPRCCHRSPQVASRPLLLALSRRGMASHGIAWHRMALCSDRSNPWAAPGCRWGAGRGVARGRGWRTVLLPEVRLHKESEDQFTDSRNFTHTHICVWRPPPGRLHGAALTGSAGWGRAGGQP